MATPIDSHHIFIAQFHGTILNKKDVSQINQAWTKHRQDEINHNK